MRILSVLLSLLVFSHLLLPACAGQLCPTAGQEKNAAPCHKQESSAKKTIDCQGTCCFEVKQYQITRLTSTRPSAGLLDLRSLLSAPLPQAIDHPPRA